MKWKKQGASVYHVFFRPTSWFSRTFGQKQGATVNCCFDRGVYVCFWRARTEARQRIFSVQRSDTVLGLDSRQADLDMVIQSVASKLRQ